MNYMSRLLIFNMGSNKLAGVALQGTKSVTS